MTKALSGDRASGAGLLTAWRTTHDYGRRTSSLLVVHRAGSVLESLRRANKSEGPAIPWMVFGGDA